MGGLLDKANDYKDSVHQGDNVGSKVVNDPSAIISAYEMGKNSANEEPKTESTQLEKKKRKSKYHLFFYVSNSPYLPLDT